jgi:hypothetical protein
LGRRRRRSRDPRLQYDRRDATGTPVSKSRLSTVAHHRYDRPSSPRRPFVVDKAAGAPCHGRQAQGQTDACEPPPPEIFSGRPCLKGARTNVLSGATRRARQDRPVTSLRASRAHRASLRIAGYGFALPANAVIAGTKAASMHTIPNATSIVLDIDMLPKVDRWNGRRANTNKR